MHEKYGWQKASVIAQLFNQPTEFEFIQAIRLLCHTPCQSELKRWADRFNFENSLKLQFPHAEIESLHYTDQYIEITSLMIGITGVQGILPYVYTTKLWQTSREQRLEAQKFLVLFNHKLTAQFVDASLCYQLPLRYELEAENHYINILHALNGYIHDQHNQHHLDDYFAEFSGLMQGQNNSKHALENILKCIFNVDIKIREYIPEKFELSSNHQCQLGGIQENLLGRKSFCGQSIKQIADKIEIVIGPLVYQQYLDFLPNAKNSKILKSILQSWSSASLYVDLRLILSKTAISPIRLSSKNQIGLAQAAFLLSEHQSNNDQTCYQLLQGIA